MAAGWLRIARAIDTAQTARVPTETGVENRFQESANVQGTLMVEIRKR